MARADTRAGDDGVEMSADGPTARRRALCHDACLAGPTFPGAARAVGALALVAALAACNATVTAHALTVRVEVNGAPQTIPAGTTFAELVADDRLRPLPGALRSVTGQVLDPAAHLGAIVLNGAVPDPATVLRAGDRIHVRDGPDTVEATRRIVRDAGVRVGNPERTLDTYPTREITVVGAISGDVVSVTDRSLGPGHAPKEVALTFDDGPWPGATRKVLAILRRFHVHATFFMVGTQAARYPGLVRAVLRAGDEIGNHSWNHPLTLQGLSPGQLTEELSKTNALLRSLGADPTLFRPPGGWDDDAVVQEARRQGMRLVTWSVDPADWRSGLTPAQVRRSVLSNVERGSIVLLHDGGGDALHTIKALPSIIRGIRHRGLRLVLVPPQPS
ncbi:MAG: polysaccharide deacetylase family protein [Planctomycetaceae bacterium]